MGLNPIVAIHSYLTMGFTLLFVYQTIINFFILKQKVIDERLVKSHIGLCAFSTVYTFISFLMVWKISVVFNVYLLHLMWISGSLITYYFIVTVKTYLGDTSEHLKFIRLLPLISAAGALVALILISFFNINIFTDPNVPLIEYRNLYMQALGGMNPHTYVKILSIFAIVPTLYSSVYFLHYIFKSKTRNRILALGIFLDFIIIINDTSISLTDHAYLFPLMFLTNVFEILRITYANQLELGKRLQQVTYDLIQSNKLTVAGTYYATLAHEILNPLHAAKGYFQLFIKQLGPENLSPGLKHYVEVINKQHQRIEKISVNVKKMTKMSSEEIISVTDLQTMIQDSIETIHARAYYAGVKIHYTPTQAPVQIKCHDDQLVQVFTNLLNNSIEAISESEEKWIRIDHKLTDNHKVVISFQDSGNGIPAQIENKIWESRFTTKKTSGIGLGLSICRSIIESHAGEIVVNPQSKHTEFLLKLPVNS